MHFAFKIHITHWWKIILLHHNQKNNIAKMGIRVILIFYLFHHSLEIKKKTSDGSSSWNQPKRFWRLFIIKKRNILEIYQNLLEQKMNPRFGCSNTRSITNTYQYYLPQAQLHKYSFPFFNLKRLLAKNYFYV